MEGARIDNDGTESGGRQQRKQSVAINEDASMLVIITTCIITLVLSRMSTITVVIQKRSVDRCQRQKHTSSVCNDVCYGQHRWFVNLLQSGNRIIEKILVLPPTLSYIPRQIKPHSMN